MSFESDLDAAGVIVFFAIIGFAAAGAIVIFSILSFLKII